MTPIHYKGFTIDFSADGQDSRVYIFKDGKLDAQNFSFDGYASANTAKGAITKHLNARAEAVADIVEVVLTCPSTRSVTPAAIDGWTLQRNERGEPVHSDLKLAHIYAELDYFGATKNRDSRSRNKREGKYTGRLDGRKSATRQGKRILSDRALASFPVPSWNAASWQNNRFWSRKVGA